MNNRGIFPVLIFVMFLFTGHLGLAAPLPFFNPDDLCHISGHDSFSMSFKTTPLSASLDKEGKKAASYGQSGISAERLHRYLGITTIALAGAAAVSSGSKDLHYGAAYSAVAAAAGTISTGIIAHGDRLTFEEGLLTADNAHIILGTLGAAGCLAAIIAADSSGGHGHSGMGVAGGALMAVSIITIKW